VFDVGQRERDELRPAQGGGILQQNDRGIAGPDGRRAVDAGDEPADLLKRERSARRRLSK
jgi:hypothetical protein